MALFNMPQYKFLDKGVLLRRHSGLPDIIIIVLEKDLLLRVSLADKSTTELIYGEKEMAKPAILHVIGKNAITMHINHEGVNINGLVFFQEATTIAYFAEGQMHVIVQEGEPHPLNMPKEHIERLTECLNNPEGKDKDKEFEKFLDDILKFIAVNAKLKGLKIEPPASS